MIRLIALNNPRMGQAFIDYMASRQIDIQMLAEGSGEFSLWLKEAEHQVEVEAELRQFLNDPTHPRYQEASWSMAESRKAKFSYGSPSMLGMVKSKAGPFTLLIMLMCAAIFGASLIGGGNVIFDLLHFPAFEWQKWQLWRWVTHALLHFSALHIIFNLLWWWQFGGDVEKKLGSLSLIKVFLVSSALSGAGQYWVEGANFGGLSGVVYGLVGYVWMLGVRAPNVGLVMPRTLIGFMLVWLVLGFVQPYMAIANTAHLVGLIAGVVLGLVDAERWRNA